VQSTTTTARRRGHTHHDVRHQRRTVDLGRRRTGADGLTDIRDDALPLAAGRAVKWRSALGALPRDRVQTASKVNFLANSVRQVEFRRGHLAGAQETYWEGVDPTAAKRMRLASTHWLRHANGSHADAAGVSLETIRRNLGHSSLQTTSAYIHAEDDRRWRGTSKLGRTRRPVE